MHVIIYILLTVILCIKLFLHFPACVFQIMYFFFPYAAILRPPVITNVNSLNTSISLNWMHDKTCFESVPVKYHVLVDTDTQPIIADQLTTEIGGVISGRVYTVSVTAVVDDSQRSDPDRESVTAGGYKED